MGHPERPTTSDPRSQGTPPAREPLFLGKGEGKAIWFLGTLVTVKAAGEDLGGAMSVVEILHRPGFATPPHLHADADELFYVLEGEATFFCGDRTVRGTPGCFAILPKGVAHGYRVEGQSPARFLVFALPAGFEKFVEEVGEAAQERTLPPEGPVDLGRLKSAAAKRGIDLLGPPPK